jgi:translation initiation factor IF-2
VAETGEKLKEWRDQDLLERSERIAGAGHAIRRRRLASGGAGAAMPGVKSGKVEVEEPITVKSLSAATGIKGAEIIKKLMSLGTMVTINQVISSDLAEAAVVDYGIEMSVVRAKTAEEELMEKLDQREKSEMFTRAPVVTFLGHVDHGKTSLLDRIRQTTVAEGEAGGITQAIGAHRHDMGDQHVVFLDTPGHEAFTAMRARGANMTDVVVLVVAADDGVMPQTIEAINHAKAAEVPIVVALNKIDVPNANVQKALGQLSEYGLQPREWGGNTEVIHTSAVTGEGVDDLVELLSLEAEILELKAETDAPASGYVVEARMDPAQGVLATLLVLNGTLKLGEVLLAGRGLGRVRQIYDDRGAPLDQAGPSTPVAVAGLDEVPEAGDRFFVAEDLDEARSVSQQRREEDRTKSLAAAGGAPRSLEELIGKIEDGEVSEIPVVLKADVQGSIEALVGVLIKIGSEETRVNILHTGVGGVSTGDVTLAEASGALIIGFNVVPDPNAQRLAEERGVNIRQYRVIYDIVEDMRRALEEGLAPEIREESLGRAEVRQIFKISRIGTIAGCYVSEGTVQRAAKVRIIRDNVVIEDERNLESLRREKDDAREVRAGLECGVKVAGFDDIKQGDVLEFYRKVEVARTL